MLLVWMLILKPQYNTWARYVRYSYKACVRPGIMRVKVKSKNETIKLKDGNLKKNAHFDFEIPIFIYFFFQNKFWDS